MKAGVYKIEHIASGRLYIGSSKDFKLRLRKHREYLRRGEHQSKALQNAWNAHGENAFAFTPLLICAEKDLIFYEQRAIDVFKAAIKPHGYNSRKLAESNLGSRTRTITYHKGDKYGMLTLIEQQGIGSSQWLCQCDCGNTKIVRCASLRQGNTKSCGCYRKKKLAELKTQHKAGDRFGRLVLISLHERSVYANGAHKWLCKCDCGKEHTVSVTVLKIGGSTSCGCYRSELLRARNLERRLSKVI